MKTTIKAANVAATSTITRGQATQMINDLPNGRFFNVTFGSKTNPARVLTGIKKSGFTEIPNAVDGTMTPAQKAAQTRRLNGYITVWDMFAKDWRAIDSRTITQLKCNKQVYRVR